MFIELTKGWASPTNKVIINLDHIMAIERDSKDTEFVSVEYIDGQVARFKIEYDVLLAKLMAYDQAIR